MDARHRSSAGTEVAFLLGKPPQQSTIFPAVFQSLHAHGIEPRLHLPHDSNDAMPEWLDRCRLVVHRGLRPAALAGLVRYEERGLRCCNPAFAVASMSDRYRLDRELRTAGLPVPDSALLATWQDVTARAQLRNLVVKRIDGRIGRSAGVTFIGPGHIPDTPPFSGPYLVQHRLENDGWDRKLYVIGKEVRGLLKPWPRRGGGQVRPFIPNARLCSLALVVGRALQLDIYGVDCIRHEGDYVVVDVNPFPAMRGVPGAPLLVADYLRQFSALRRS